MIAIAFLSGAACCYALLVTLGALARWEVERQHRDKVERNRRMYERESAGWPKK